MTALHIATQGLTGDAYCIATGGHSCIAALIAAFRYLRGGPDITDELPGVVRRRPSRYDKPEWQEEWSEEDEWDLQLALEKLTRAPPELESELRVTFESELPAEPPAPIPIPRQTAELRPVVQRIQQERGISRAEAITTLTSGLESQLLVAHREQLITDDELLVLLLTIM